ncbi:MAG: insulinase family protein [Acidobacteria bacterium]|nr:insulinase family protein [Acidobacteriota bacterium]
MSARVLCLLNMRLPRTRALSIIWLCIALAPELVAQSWQQIPIPPLPSFQPQEPKRIQLPNGLVIFLQEDHELPLISASIRIRGGSRSEPASKVGLVSVYGEVWRTGGTKTETGDQLDDYLEIRAAKVETEGNADSTVISLDCLKEDFNDVFRVFSDLLLEPEFREDKVDLARREAFDAISRRNDQISDVARREASKLAYGADNPYARVPEYASIGAVTRQDLLNWHHTYVHPNNMIIGVLGDFDSNQMEARLRKLFGALSKGPIVPEPDIQFSSQKAGYYQIKKEDVNQSAIRMVALGTTRKNPDYYAIEVFNEAMGGGFSARLIQSIRSAKGLAYSVGGGIGTRFDHPGILQFAMGTKSNTTVESIEALYDEIDKLKTSPITEAEIARAKDSILNAFVFNFDTPEKVLRERMAYEFYGYPADFLERYRAGVEKVTAAEVNRVAEKYVHRQELAVLVVGNTAEFDKPLSTLGPVTSLDITIPPPPGQSSAAAQNQSPTENRGSNPEGQALATKVADALGGLAKLESVKALKSDFQLTQHGGPIEGTIQAESTVVFPDHMKLDLETPQGNMSLVVSPDSAFMAAQGMGVQDLPSSRKNESIEQIHRDIIYIAQHVSDPAFSFSAAGRDNSGGSETAILDIAGPGVTMRWFVDPQSGKIVRETYRAMGQSGLVDTETDLSDWKQVEGLNLPFHRENKQAGREASTVQFKTIQLNPTLDPRIFNKPESPAH